jgi:fatty-acyl-CoA synthase
MGEAVALKSYRHRGGETPLLGVTIPEQFAATVRRFSDRDAVVALPQGQRLSYHLLADRIDQVACGLVAWGVGRGTRVGVWSTNNVGWVILQMATARIGAILVNINPAYRLQELSYALQRSEVEFVFTIPRFRTSRYVDMLVELVPELKAQLASQIRSARFPHLKRVVVYDPAGPERFSAPLPGFSTWKELIEASPEISLAQLQQITNALEIDDPINIQYTSGTTGLPKAVVLTHHNILNNAYFSALAMHFSENDRLCVPVPFYHCFGMVLANVLCFSVGACLVIPAEHFDPYAVLQAIEAERCTAVHGVPTMFIAELEHPEFTRFNLGSLRTGIMAGAPCPAPLVHRVMNEMHCREILIGYGQTEASPITHLTSRDDTMERRVDTVGTNLPHQEVKVVDTETGATLPVGKIGEICFRGYHLMRGYYGDREATAKAIDADGWLHSGDLGAMDDGGYLRITGRLKDMIIRGGENIYPREIEETIFSHPKVAQVAVFGVPDAFYGEEIAAWVQLHGGESASVEEIKAYCRDRLAHFKVPKKIRFVDDFPMTVTGKLQKFRMQELEAEFEKRASAAAV